MSMSFGITHTTAELEHIEIREEIDSESRVIARATHYPRPKSSEPGTWVVVINYYTSIVLTIVTPSYRFLDAVLRPLVEGYKLIYERERQELAADARRALQADMIISRRTGGAGGSSL